MPVDLLAEATAIAARVSGWDLSAINQRLLDPGPAWDYETEARALVAAAETVLDCGTGGGEVYERIIKGLKVRCFATEEWPPNARIAKARLTAYGAPVVQADSLRLPFRSRSFDVVLSRHEAIDPAGVDRVLRPGGVFLTQQVSSDHWPELRPFFPNKAVFPNHDVDYRQAFEAMGYTVEFHAVRFRSSFASIADLAAMLLVAPWEVPGFDLARDKGALLAVQRELETKDGIVVSEERYLLQAVKR
jgi:SAM-dependent methyltransferase